MSFNHTIKIYFQIKSVHSDTEYSYRFIEIPLHSVINLVSSCCILLPDRLVLYAIWLRATIQIRHFIRSAAVGKRNRFNVVKRPTERLKNAINCSFSWLHKTLCENFNKDWIKYRILKKWPQINFNFYLHAQNLWTYGGAENIWF